MIHAGLTVVQFLGHDVWHWKSGNGYQFWSGIESAIERPLGWVAFAGIYLRHHNCHLRGCWRLAWHPDPTHGHPVCKKHHPHDPRDLNGTF